MRRAAHGVARTASAAALTLLVSAAALVAAQPNAAPAAAAPTAAAATPAPAPAADNHDHHEPPRKSYNQGRAAYESHDLAKAESGFLAARDQSEADEEVRYRAAFNLALTYAQKADGLTKEKPQDALAALQQSAAWFRDAVHGRPEDPDARHNLEVILRRIQQLADQLNKGQNTLEARLARVIQDERTLRDRVRALLSRVNQAGSAAEPLNFQGEFDDTATFQRTLLSDAGAILDLAGEQRDQIAQRPEPQRSDEDRGKLVQLQNLEHYLNLGRGTMADVARLLRRLQGDKSHRQSDVAVTQLKRALEQLQDPVTVLKGLTTDQTTVYGQTRALAELRQGTLRIPVAGEPEKSQKAAAPPWLTTTLLGDQQKDLQPRTSELLARLQAGVEHESQAAANASKPAAQQPPGQPQGQPKDPREEAAKKHLIEAARQAIPILQETAQSMGQAATALQGDELQPATQAEMAAIAGLVKALERFSGTRDLIELAYADQSQVVTLVTPPGKTDGKAEGQTELAKLSTQERTNLVKEALVRNLDRLGRLKGLFADEVAALQAPPPASPQGSPQGGDGKAEQEKLAAEKQRYELAEQYRKQAEAAVSRLTDLIGKPGKPGKAEPLQPTAEEGKKHLEELRRLFFSIVEHLKELLRNQTETHDSTSSAQASREESEKQRKLGPLVAAQDGHATMGKALAEALAAQADQAQNAKDPQAQQAQKSLSEAAEEVRKGQSAMATAAQTLKDDQKQAATMSFDLEAPIEQQKQAMAHIEAAIRILEPPQQDQKKDQPQDKQNQDQQISQEQAARRLQAIREREAERQRKQQPPAQPEPVEKDW